MAGIGIINMEFANLELVDNTTAVCAICGKVKDINELKYVSKFNSKYAIPACDTCRKVYSNSLILHECL